MLIGQFDTMSLVSALKKRIPLQLARIKALAMMIVALVEARSIKLSILARFLPTGVSKEARYRRMQRFIAQIKFLPSQLAPTLLDLMEVDPNEKLTLILDRTNWKFGRQHQNILYLAVAHKGVGIPLFGKF